MGVRRRDRRRSPAYEGDLSRAVRLWVGLAIPLVCIGFLATFTSPSIERSVTTAFVLLIVVIGLYMFVGNSGVLSFGHIGFMSIGAYATAVVAIPVTLKAVTLPDLPSRLASMELPWYATPFVGGAVAAVFAVVIGIIIMRASGIAAAIATLSILVIVNVVTSNWPAIGGGQTLVGLPNETDLPIAVGGALLALAAGAALQHSPIGRKLQASREDPVAARACGINITRARSVAFVASAFVVGAGGALYTGLLGTLSPDQFYFGMTFMTLAMLVIGGMHSLTGAVVGTAVVSFISELLIRLEEGVTVAGILINARPGLKEVILALLMIAALILRPEGLVGRHELRLKWLPLPQGSPDRQPRARLGGSAS